MTSDDADKVREAEAAALREAKEEAAAGGVKVGAEGGDNALIVRGEDVLTQVTHGLVCLLRVRSALLDTVCALGFVPKVRACGAGVGWGGVGWVCGWRRGLRRP